MQSILPVKNRKNIYTFSSIKFESFWSLLGDILIELGFIFIEVALVILGVKLRFDLFLIS